MTNIISKEERKPTIYYFSGLGADHRAFSQLKIHTQLPQIHVQWLKPMAKESLSHYSKRITYHYNIQQCDVLIGLSFGGLVVTEISLLLGSVLCVLISSASCRKELPFLYKLSAYLSLHRLISSSFLKNPNDLKYLLFGLKTKAQKQLLNEILAATDLKFIRWAIHQVVSWENKTRPPHLYKIHGTADRIIPIHIASSDFIIKGGSHFMTLENAPEISEIISQLLKKIPEATTKNP